MKRHRFVAPLLSGFFLASAVGCSSSNGGGGDPSSGDSGGQSGGSKSGGSSGASSGGKSGSSGGSSGSSGGSSGSSGGSSGSSGGSSGSTGGGSGTDSGAGGGGPAGTGGADGTGTGGAPSDAGGPMLGLDKTPLPGDGCAGGVCQNPMCQARGTAAAIGTFASIGDPGEIQPGYIPNNMIIPTFDDAPDGAIAEKNEDGTPNNDFAMYGGGKWTRKIVEFFDANNLHGDFFLNTNNWCNEVNSNPECLTDIQKILKTQNPGNHTVHHIWMEAKGHPTLGVDPNDLSSNGCGVAGAMFPSCEDELKGVEDIVNVLSNMARPHLTRFRAPYGWPFFNGGIPTGGVVEAKKVIAKFAVHVGWHMDSRDSIDPPPGGKIDSQTIISNVTSMLGNAGTGQNWGIVLMHGTYPWSYDAAKALFDPKTGYLATHGFKMATVEDAICWKYGMHSWDIVNKLTPGANRAKN
jgi:peptidoglycan/xylan/chitin deacetylase (PgdA/CDA1 family)